MLALSSRVILRPPRSTCPTAHSADAGDGVEGGGAQAAVGVDGRRGVGGGTDILAAS